MYYMPSTAHSFNNNFSAFPNYYLPYNQTNNLHQVLNPYAVYSFAQGQYNPSFNAYYPGSVYNSPCLNSNSFGNSYNYLYSYPYPNSYNNSYPNSYSNSYSGFYSNSLINQIPYITTTTSTITSKNSDSNKGLNLILIATLVLAALDLVLVRPIKYFNTK